MLVLYSNTSKTKDEDDSSEKTKREEEDVKLNSMKLQYNGWDLYLNQQGVFFNPVMSKWMVVVTIGGMNQCIGYYDTAREAKIAYSRALDMHSVSVENSGREHNAQAGNLNKLATMAQMYARSRLPPPAAESTSHSQGEATVTGAFHSYSYVSVIARSNLAGAGGKDGD